MTNENTMTMEASQHDETATDMAMLCDTLRQLDPYIRRVGLPTREVRTWEQATDLAYKLMVRTEGTALVMREVIRLARVARLDRRTAARIKQYIAAYPNELGPTDNECSPSYSGVQGEDEQGEQEQRAVHVKVRPDVRNTYG